MTTINIGIVAHVDAGKTSLTERILYETHVIDEIGRVDKGTTQTDSLELEKRRGITIKASVVSTQSLARQAERLRLGEHLILGRGEEKTGGRFKAALLADAYEALIAAIYLDGGLEAAGAFLRREFHDAIEDGQRPDFDGEDLKSALQERLQALGRPLPDYRVSGQEGPDHRKIFHVDVVVGGETMASATGRAKKEAEQEAARLALDRLA